MNKQYIKIVLALLSVTGYMQNIAFASEYDSSANSSNEECKQQLASAPEEVKEELVSTPEEVKEELASILEEVKEQLSSTTEEVKEELVSTPEEAKEELASILEEVKEQLSSTTEDVKEELASTPEEVKEQVSSTPEDVKEQVSSTPQKTKQVSFRSKTVKQQLSPTPNTVKQQRHFIPITFKEKEKFNPAVYNHQLSLKINEGKHAEHVMTDALNAAKEHVKSTKDYKLYSKKYKGESLHFKSVNNAEIGMLEFTIPNADNYNDIVKMLWDPNGEKKFNRVFVEGSFSRVYNTQLAIIQQRYQGLVWDRYYNAVARKYQLSEDETAIVLTSSDMDDNNYDNTKYVNPIVKSANTFNPIIESDDHRDRVSTKMQVNLVAFFIKKEANGVKITHLCSMNYDFSSGNKQQRLRELIASKMFSAVNLRDIVNKA
ncbi:fam-a protein [Plasmodium chabaudi chabaudi]|uniref:Fam-a protein n=1 Tax=Plasmodium chabaudi chabaudi TaxID=31271 RepID=A0A4V6M8W9_PLACU|nr:fam-a protein [Plasmodium chabaudi chabaudi]VTZ67111.1 fam-a protein [Plasmodium chabaudi chabaudi]|eukprot:XP_016652922.1 fam-a protein [Plasmodium chabaudi chabaudi]